MNHSADEFADLIAMMDQRHEAANTVRPVLPQLWPDQQHARNTLGLQNLNIDLA